MDAAEVPGQDGGPVFTAQVRNAPDLSTDAAIVELRTMAQDVPPSRSLVDELLAERRAETVED